jgi:hypothetical protein
VPVQTASSLTVITASQATPAAGNAFTAAESLNDSAQASSTFVTGVVVSADSPALAGAVIDLFTLAQQSRVAGTLTGVSVNQTQSCPGGGSISVSGNVANPNTVSSGDNVTIAATNCSISGLTIGGGFNIALNSLTGTVSSTTPWSTRMAITFNGFNVISGTDTALANGDMTLAFSQTDSTHRSFGLSGTALQLALSRSGTQLSSRTLQGYTASATLAGSTITQSVNYTLAGSSTALGQFNVSVKTLTPFVRTAGAFPASGSLIVSGAASSVTLTAVDATAVRLDYSAKGDGVITSSSTLTWAQLKASV